MNAEHVRKLRKLRELCPNARVDVRDPLGHNGRLNTDSVDTIGEATTVLDIGGNNDVIANLELIGNACPNLEQISCFADDIPPSGFLSLFEVPKPKLVQFNVRASRAAMQVVDSIFEVFAEKV